MKKRKAFHAKNASSKRHKTQISKDDEFPPPKGLSKTEIQDLIRKEILARLKQSDEKMDELIGRTQRIECISNYEGRFYKLQADIQKIKRRGQAALAHVRRLQASGRRMSPEELRQAPCSSTGSEELYIVDSPSCVRGQAGPIPVETRAGDSPSVVSSTSETLSNIQDCAETLEENQEKEVLFCGVLLPKRSIVEGFCQNQLNGNPVVDLTSEGREDTAATPNSSQKNKDAGDGPSQETPTSVALHEEAFQPALPRQAVSEGPTGPAQLVPNVTAELVQLSAAPKDSVSCGAAAASTPVPVQADSGALTEASVHPGARSHGTPAAPPTQSFGEGDWMSKLPPLPAIPLPAALPSEAAGTKQPQKLQLKAARIEKPKAIGLLWSTAEADPWTALPDSYHIFFTQSDNRGCFSQWRSIAVIKAMPLPMACKLTSYAQGHRLCFSVVAEDKYGRYGPYSEIQTIASSET